MSAEISTLTRTAAARILAATPSQERHALEPLVDAVLRMLWQLVGAYVWVVLVLKHDRPGTSPAVAASGIRRPPAGPPNEFDGDFRPNGPKSAFQASKTENLRRIR